jgi:glycosyltransferase involved in cell wall biosynthesis
MLHVVVMVTSSYPRFPGDTVGTFMEPIAHGVANLGHQVHVVAPWHPRLERQPVEGGVRFHFYRYAPHPALNVFGYAGALREDVALRWSAWAAVPLAVTSGVLAARRVARTFGATVMHAHWVIPGGVTAYAAGPTLPLVVSLHGSDVYIAERHPLVGRAARAVFHHAGWVTACSDDLRRRAIALGASTRKSEVVPYGVDPERFRPSPTTRHDVRQALGIAPESALIVAVGRFVRKKGFEYLIDAVARLVSSGVPVTLALAGGGDLDAELRDRSARAGIGDRARFLGVLPHDRAARLLAAADVVAVPSIHDDAGNVDGLPNVLLEALASGAPVVATPAGGIGAVVRDGETGILVPERDSEALAAAIGSLVHSPDRRRQLGEGARREAQSRFGWEGVARRFEAAYDTVTAARRRGADAKTRRAPQGPPPA